MIELLRNSRDKRARKLAKKRVRLEFPPGTFLDTRGPSTDETSSSVPSVVPRRRSTSSSVSLPSPVVPATKRNLANVDFRQATTRVRTTSRRYLMGISWTKNLVEGPRIWALLPHVERAARRQEKRHVDTK